ncbi:MAG: divalent-cation tolerance protein CutA [candidate division Zixibacteria bacterium]|nr:divalent-cation tolerance protein CutA [candidate division Zixibacteria bacterium]
MHTIRVVLITVPADEAKEMALEIVKRRLAACVNIVSKVESIFWWDDEVQTSQECLLIVKTTQLMLERLIDHVVEAHPYDLPEIIALPVTEGLPDYINWVLDETGKEAGSA